ncbi:hypothetical protein SLEP1_g6279 [Rubroshorea leprosula]|uniref:Transposase MuDR plant domain-containing protein n=1 Tax=Rubroshorea leprosula TaxID=152421 RepID=A0AAV5HUZ1_9ROSI|nr:hypothetical protein SLEP1_g6279 [Rubroshorea leprosula]
MAREIIDIDLEGDSDGSKNECNKKVAPGDDVNKGQETNNAGKGVETEGPINGKAVDGEVRVEEGQKETVVEDYYELGQDFTAQGVWLKKEDEAGVEKERACASKSDNVADVHNDDLNGDKEAKGDKGHDDFVMDILELTDNENEEAIEARRKVKSFCYNLQEDNAGPSSYHDGGVNAAGPSTPPIAVHDDGDEIQIYEEVENALPNIRLGMTFVSKAQFKAIVDRCNMMQMRDIKWKKNDSKWIRAVCKHAPSCDWKILLSKDAMIDSWMAKTYIYEHTCSEELTSKRCNSTSASKYLVKKMGFASLYLKSNDIFQTIRRNTGLELTRKQCKKVREKIARVFVGNCLMEYSKLWNYATELRRRDPVATILIQAPRSTTDTSPIFMIMYVCFSIMKLGFVTGCRRVMGVDEAFLKEAYKGVLLMPVGRDANDQICPLTWPIVEVEKTKTWRWHKPIFSMLEDLRMMCGRRTIARRTFAKEKFVGDLVLEYGRRLLQVGKETRDARCYGLMALVMRLKKKTREVGNNEASEATKNLNDNNPVSQADDPTSQVANEERRPI